MLAQRLAPVVLALFPVMIAAAPCSDASRPKPQAIQLQGTIIEGGSPGSFTKTIDLRTGWSTMTEVQGVATEMRGFDGMPWTAGNGITVRVDAPPFVAAARADAFVDRLAWSNGARLPTVHVRLNPDKTAGTVKVDGDQGTRTVMLSDWRCVSGFEYPFEQTTIGASGESSIIHVRSLRRIVANAATFAPPAAQHRAILNGPSPVEVPFQFTGAHDPHILVDASVDGHRAKVIFDTGADHYFGVRSAQAWGMPVSGGVDIGGAGAGSVSGGFARVKSISIGGAELRDQTVAVGPLPWPSAPNSADGLTGFQFFAQFRTTIDYQNRMLRFEPLDTAPSPSDGAITPFYTDGDGHMYVPALVNGVRGLFNIDTGDGIAITLFRTFAQRAGLTGLDAASDSTGSAFGGSVSLASVPVTSFSLAGTTLSNLHVKVAKMRSGFFASKGIAGNLGGGLFRCFALTIDYRARTIAFAKQPDTQDCLGRV